MTDYDVTTEKRTVRTNTKIHDPHFLGVDGAGNGHWWSPYHRTFAKVVVGQVITKHIDDTAVNGLEEYCRAFEQSCGEWQVGPRVVGYDEPATASDRAMEALR